MQYRMLRMVLNNLLDPSESEHFKYHVLLDHLKVDQAKQLALAFSYALNPYTQAIKALDERNGQPRQLALKELRNIMDLPPITVGDGHALDNFALRVQALVGLLGTMEWSRTALWLSWIVSLKSCLQNTPVTLNDMSTGEKEK